VKKLKVRWYAKGIARQSIIEPAEMETTPTGLIIFKDRDNNALLIVPVDKFVDAEDVTE
jgi:hypothetical protein